MDGRTVLVTGADCGLGAEVAHTLAVDHTRLVGLHAHSLQAETVELAARIEDAGVETVLLPFDLVERPLSSSRRVVETFLDAAESTTGRREVHLVVNNAGAADHNEPSDVMQHLLRLSRLNLAAPMFIVKALLPYLASNGRVINISTSLNQVAAPYRAACVANKAALDSMTTSLASVLAERGATINAVLPGYDERMQPTAGKIDAAPFIAQIVRFLASDDAHSITGHLIDVPADSGPHDRVPSRNTM